MISYEIIKTISSIPDEDFPALFLAAELLLITPKIISGDGAFRDGEIL
jgi:hypothetical protein